MIYVKFGMVKEAFALVGLGHDAYVQDQKGP